MTERSAFAGGDQQYLREVQYGTGAKLDVRSHLHRAYGTAPVGFPTFEAGLVDWPETADVLECGCGTGRFWETASLPRTLSLTLTDLSPGMVAEGVARAHEHGFTDATGDLLVTDPADAVAYGLSFPPGEHADDAQRAAFAATVDRRYTDGIMRIRTRAGVFVCRQPLAG